MNEYDFHVIEGNNATDAVLSVFSHCYYVCIYNINKIYILMNHQLGKMGTSGVTNV